MRNIQPFNGFAPMQDIERLLNKMFPKNSALVLILLHARKLDGRFYLSGGLWSVLWPGSTIPAVFPKTMKCLSVLHKLFAPLLPSALYSSGFSLLVQLLKGLADQSYYDLFVEIVQKDEQAIFQLGDISKCIEGTPMLDKAGILRGDIEAMDAATCFVLSDIQSNSEFFIQEFPIEGLYSLPAQANYTLARFFADLAWYFPPSKRAYLHELKRALSLLPD